MYFTVVLSTFWSSVFWAISNPFLLLTWLICLSVVLLTPAAFSLIFILCIHKLSMHCSYSAYVSFRNFVHSEEFRFSMYLSSPFLTNIYVFATDVCLTVAIFLGKECARMLLAKVPYNLLIKNNAPLKFTLYFSKSTIVDIVWSHGPITTSP